METTEARKSPSTASKGECARREANGRLQSAINSRSMAAVLSCWMERRSWFK
jgi:hypothetical protein